MHFSYTCLSIPPHSLQEANWSKVQARFTEEGSVQLQNFLSKQWAQQVTEVGGAAGMPGLDRADWAWVALQV